MAMAATELVALAVERCGGVAKLAQRMGLGTSGSSQVSNWKQGRSALSYENTMRLLEACDWLKISEKPLARAQPDNPLAELGESVATILQNQHAAMEILKGLRERDQTPPVEKRAAPKRKAR